MQNKTLVVSPPTVTGAHALPAVLRGDEVRPCCGVVTHSPLPHHHSVPATPRWATSAHTTIMRQSQDVQTQRIFYCGKDSGEALSRHGPDGAVLSSPDQKDLHVDWSLAAVASWRCAALVGGCSAPSPGCAGGLASDRTRTLPLKVQPAATVKP